VTAEVSSAGREGEGVRPSLARYAWLSIAAAIATISLKTAAYLLTGSVGLLSDAIESGVNLVAAVIALAMLSIAARPADDEHAFGHDKAEYFSSGAEGILIVLAAISISWASIERLIHPQPIEKPGLGLAISVGASLVNFFVARVLFAAGRRHRSITLEADAHHLMTDVWTSAGVLVAVGAVAVTGWNRLDPIVGIVVAANIVWMGFKLARRSALGLMDSALPEEELASIRKILDRAATEGTTSHALRTRQAASRRFVSFDLLVPGSWAVERGHALADRLEREIGEALGNASVTIHVEPIESSVAHR
jgi:cation diffusion facilitator family transporter